MIRRVEELYGQKVSGGKRESGRAQQFTVVFAVKQLGESVRLTA
jgi:hypothetical protein